MKQIITATIAVILVCLVATPLIDDAARSISTVEQNTGERFDMYKGQISGEIEITTAAGSITVGDTTINTVDNGVPSFLFVSDVIQVTAGGSPSYPTVKVIDSKNGIVYNMGSSTSTKVSISGDTVSYAISETTYTAKFTWCYVFSINGNYGQWYEYGGNSAKNVYIDNKSDVFLIKGPASSNTEPSEFGLFKFDGSTVKPVSVVKLTYSASPGTVTSMSASEYTIKAPTITNTDLGYYISDFDATMTVGENSYYLAVLAPIEYHIITDEQSVVISLLQILPVLMIAAVIIGIGYAIMRRD